MKTAIASILVVVLILVGATAWVTYSVERGKAEAMARDREIRIAAEAEAEHQKQEKARREAEMKAYKAESAAREVRRKVFEEQYNQKFQHWKEGILANTAVTAVAASSPYSVLVSLTIDKYQSVQGAQNIARQLANSYSYATGIKHVHFYVMAGSQQFADAWND
jgi:uncharacterized protein YxeA